MSLRHVLLVQSELGCPSDIPLGCRPNHTKVVCNNDVPVRCIPNLTQLLCHWTKHLVQS